jgi:hypothetical protein
VVLKMPVQTTVTKKELMEMGYGPGQAGDLIRRAKASMVQKGFAYYNSKRLGRVPKEAVEEVLGIELILTPESQEVASNA